MSTTADEAPADQGRPDAAGHPRGGDRPFRPRRLPDHLGRRHRPDASVGGTVAYAYFPNKEALFLAAVDEDAAGVINEGLATVLGAPDIGRWHESLIFTLVDAVERHPLARRLLAGLEPEVTVRVLDIPALTELRKACTEMLRSGQAAGTVRPDIDAAVVASGIVALMLSVLMSVTQLGSQAAVAYAQDVAAVFDAALTSPVPVRA